jgi:hypothetical protein
MCLKTKNVVASHLIPARAYDYFRAPGAHPIALNSQVVMASDRELKFPLLCAECEDRLNKGGEMWLLPLFATYEGPFPFYDLLTKCKPDIVAPEGTGYAASKNPAIEVDKIIHFAMGIFFKAAAHSWKGDTKEPLIALGPYTESLRAFVMGEIGFPATDDAQCQGFASAGEGDFMLPSLSRFEHGVSQLSFLHLRDRICSRRGKPN